MTDLDPSHSGEIPDRSVRARLLGLLVALDRRRQVGGRAGRVLLIVALVLFAGVAGTSLAAGDAEVPAAAPLIAGLALAAASIFMNGLEFGVSGRLSGAAVDLPSAVRVSILGSAANVLPLPGAALVRIRALREGDIGYKRAAAVTAAVGLAWVATAALLAGGLAFANRHPLPGVGLLAGGLAGAAGSRVLLGRGVRRPLVGQLVSVEVVSIVLTIIRLLVLARAVGIDADAGDAALLTVAGVLASAAGLFPGGLGLREVLSAALATGGSISPADAVIVATTDRVVLLVALACSAGVLLITERRRTPAPIEAEG